MRNIIIVLWITLIGFIGVPIGASYISAVPDSQVMEVIQKETETDNLVITSSELLGNKAMYSFKTSNDYGVAVFDRFADKSSYAEGTLGNGEKNIKVRLDTGWDVYLYEVTEKGAELKGMEPSQGIYKMYAVIAGALAVVTIIAAVAGIMRKSKKGDINHGKKLS